MEKWNDLEMAVERQLREANMEYVREPVVGQTRPDFLVTTNKGDKIVIEVKAWAPNPENIARAINQAKRYKELSKAAAALIVIASGMSLSLPVGGISSVADFLAVLTKIASKLAQTRRARKIIKSIPSPQKRIFASMPFRAQYDDTFLVAIQPAALTLGAVAERVDHNGRPGGIVQQIKEMINTAQAIVADLSESRANVCHEVGYAEALGKPVIQISSTPLDSLPFNLRNNQTIPYVIGQVTRLRAKIEKELTKVM